MTELKNEILNSNYVPVSEIDAELEPPHVIIYLINNSAENKKIIIEPLAKEQLVFENQNPSVVVNNNIATFCLVPSPYIPIVTINPISDFTDPEYPLTVTVTGTISRTDVFIPNSILVEYYGITKRASLVDDTNWTVTFDLHEVTVDTIQTVSAIANSIDVNNPEQEGEFSEPVEEQFNVLFTVVECIPVTDRISCICLNPNKSYRITIDGQEPFTGTFMEVVQYLDSQKMYAYPGGLECDPCAFSLDKFTISRIIRRPSEE